MDEAIAATDIVDADKASETDPLKIINVACISCALIAATVKKSVDEVLSALGHCIRLSVA